MRIFSIIFFLLGLSFVASASDPDGIISLLQKNVGATQGTVQGNQGTCQIHIYKPGEYTADTAYYVEYVWVSV